MTDDDEMVYLGAEIPKEKAEAVKSILDHGEQTDLIRFLADVIVETGGFERDNVFAARIQKVKNKLEQKTTDRDRLNRDIDDLTDELESLRERRERVLSQEDQYQATLEQLERGFRAGDHGHLDPGHPRIQEVANQYDLEPTSVLDDLKERNPDVPPKAFKDYRAVSGSPFKGLSDDQVTLPLEDRESLDGPQT